MGDSVGYDITGSTPRGVPKIKITRNPKPGEGTVWSPNDENPELEAVPQSLPPPPRYNSAPMPQPARQSAPTAAGTPKNTVPVHGATIGMCVKGALDIWLQQEGSQGRAWGADSINFVYGTANQILGICQRLENHAAEAESSDIPF